MPDPNCKIRGCIHMPGFVIECGYNLELALASVGSGWAELVRAGMAAAEGRGQIVQVKEKFGGLRLYADPLPGAPAPQSEAMYEALQDLEARSMTICEQCGAAGQMTQRGGWWLTLCAVHASANKFQSEEKD